MARIRTVKPDMWTDEDFIDLSMPARLMFVASLNFADDYGVLADKPRTLAARTLPVDEVDAVAVVDELVAARFYVRTVSPDGSKVLVIRTFSSHQKIDKRTKGRWGDPSEWDLSQEWPESHPIPPHPAESPHIPPKNSHGREGRGRDIEGKPAAILVDDPIGPVDKPAAASLIEEALRTFAQWRVYEGGFKSFRAAWSVIRKPDSDEFRTLTRLLNDNPDATHLELCEALGMTETDLYRINNEGAA